MCAVSGRLVLLSKATADQYVPVDKILESCFQLLSLFYLTIGRNNEAPAAYSLTSTIKRLLDHLTEAALYSAKDLESIKSTLEETAKAISEAQKTEESKAKHSPYLLTLLAKRVALCQTMLNNLRRRLEGIGAPLLAIHEKLISILRQISLANTKSKVSVVDPPLFLQCTWLTWLAALVFDERGAKAAESAARGRRETQRWQVSL